jgi:hypothetical protein
MAVVKIKYTRNRRAVKAHLRYITHRRGREDKTTTRTLFTEGGIITKQAAYELIDSVKPGTVFYKIILSPDPRREDSLRDLNLWQLTRSTAAALQAALKRDIRFLAVEHNDHTPHRHVHAIFLIPGKLSRQEFRTLATLARRAATEEARLQRQARDLLLQHSRSQTLRQILTSARSSEGVNAPPLQSGCRVCGYGELSGIPAFYAYCPSCHERLSVDNQHLQRMEIRL